MVMSEFGVVIAAFAVLGLLYPHVIYPFLLLLIPQRKSGSSTVTAVTAVTATDLPTVDVCISAYNEEVFIEQCLQSIIDCGYPHDRLRIIVGDDGSSDSTVSSIHRVMKQNPTVQIVLVECERMGKNGVMSRLIDRSSSEIVVFTDADARFHQHAIERLIQPLSRTDVAGAIGCVSRTHSDAHNDAAAEGEASYRTMDRSMNIRESAIASTVTSNGALYAVERKYAQTLPNMRVADDWVTVLRCVADNKRVVLVPDATVEELRTVDLSGEFHRTIRTSSSGMATVWMFRQLLFAFTPFAFFLFSHRVMRWLSPVFLVLLLVATVLSIHSAAVFAVLVSAQIVLYVSALIGHIGSKAGVRVPVASLALYFVAMNIAFLLAMFRFMGGGKFDAWDPSAGVSA